MGNLERRLMHLESSQAHQEKQGRGTSARERERYFHAHENAQREMHGLDPLPDLEYTEEDRQDDLRTLHEHIPAMRVNQGWQTEEAQAFLDEWERELREKLTKEG